MWAMARKELTVVLRDRGALLTLFLSPVLFIVVMSLALGESFAGLDEESDPIRILVVDEDGDEAVNDLVSGLSGADGLSIITDIDGDPLTLAVAEQRIRDGDDPMAVVVPSGFTDNAREGEEALVGVIVDPTASAQAMRPLEAAVTATAATVAGRYHSAELLAEQMALEPDPDRRAELQERIDALSDDGSVLASADIEFPSGAEAPLYPSVYQQNVPGYTIMYVFFIVTTMAGAIMSERREGTFPRLLSAPVARWRILLGKIVPYLLVALVQVGVLTAFGRFVFGMELGDHPLALVPVTLALALCAVSLGVLLAAFARSDSQVTGMGTILILALAALGGCMVPLVFMPDFMADVAAYTPHGQALIAFQDVMVRGAGVMDVLPAAGILTGLAALFFLVALPRFRFRM